MSFVVAQQQRGKYPDQKATFCHRSTRLSDFGQHIERSDIKGSVEALRMNKVIRSDGLIPIKKGLWCPLLKMYFPKIFAFVGGDPSEDDILLAVATRSTLGLSL